MLIPWWFSVSQTLSNNYLCLYCWAVLVSQEPPVPQGPVRHPSGARQPVGGLVPPSSCPRLLQVSGSPCGRRPGAVGGRVRVACLTRSQDTCLSANPKVHGAKLCKPHCASVRAWPGNHPRSSGGPQKEGYDITRESIWGGQR